MKSILLRFPKSDEFQRLAEAHAREERLVGHDLTWKQFILRMVEYTKVMRSR